MLNTLFFKPKFPVNLNKKFALRLLARRLALALWGCAVLPMSHAQAQATLLVTPTRVVFDGSARSQELLLSNKGNEAGTYRISFVNKHVKEDGTYVDAAEPGPTDQFADSMLRASVREITLQPGQVKVIRVLLRKPDGLPDGEYRTHVLFDVLDSAPPAAATTAADLQANQKKQEDQGKRAVGFQIKALYSLSIPAIVRQGKLNATATLTSGSLTYDPKTRLASLGVTLNRSGNRSIYGDLTLQVDGKEIYVQRGTAVHASASVRRMTLSLTKDQYDKIMAQKDKVRVVFEETEAVAEPARAEVALN